MAFTGFTGNFKFGQGAPQVTVTPVKMPSNVGTSTSSKPKSPAPLKISGKCINCGGR